MASRCRRYRPRRLQALQDNPQLLVIRPSPPPAGLNDLQPFYLSTVLMAVHKHCYTSLKLTQQGGPDRRETVNLRSTRLEFAEGRRDATTLLDVISARGATWGFPEAAHSVRVHIPATTRHRIAKSSCGPC